MNHFVMAWLPSIIGTLLAWFIGWRQGKLAAHAAAHQTLVLQNLLRKVADAGLIGLEVDDEGVITGGALQPVDPPPPLINRRPGNVTVLQNRFRAH